MTEAPEKIWAAYPASGKRLDDTIYGYDLKPFGPDYDDWLDDDFDNPILVAEYTRSDIAKARIEKLYQVWLHGDLTQTDFNEAFKDQHND
jgi:hypothetical protein